MKYSIGFLTFLTFLTFVVVSVVSQHEFIDQTCNGHHRRMRNWKTSIPADKHELAQLYHDRCLRPPLFHSLDPTERQYVTYKHKDDSKRRSFDYERHHVRHSFVDVIHDSDNADGDCRSLQEEDLATCAVPVIDITERIKEARGIHPDAFVLSYMLPNKCDECVAQVHLKVSKK